MPLRSPGPAWLSPRGRCTPRAKWDRSVGLVRRRGREVGRRTPTPNSIHRAAVERENAVCPPAAAPARERVRRAEVGPLGKIGLTSSTAPASRSRRTSSVLATCSSSSASEPAVVLMRSRSRCCPRCRWGCRAGRARGRRRARGRAPPRSEAPGLTRHRACIGPAVSISFARGVGCDELLRRRLATAHALAECAIVASSSSMASRCGHRLRLHARRRRPPPAPGIASRHRSCPRLTHPTPGFVIVKGL
jgi:hypothetical protein